MAIHFDEAKSFLPKNTADILNKANLENGGLVQKVVDKAVIDYDLQYVPFLTGTLGQSAYSASQIGSGKVVYPGPYARYLYYGEVYGPNCPITDGDGNVLYFRSPAGKKKHPTGRPLTYDTSKNALAGSYWFERMKADHLNDIIEEAKKAVGTRN